MVVTLISGLLRRVGSVRVLKGFSLDHYRPHMVIVELDITSAEPSIRERVDWITAHMMGNGYGIIYQDAINTIFVRRYDA